MSEEYTEESSEQPDSTPESTETESQPVPEGAEPIDAAPEQQEEKPAPFHEHPRFKELIEQNRTFKEQSERYQQDLYRIQGQLESFKQQSAPKPKEEPVNQFVADLEKVNPAYAETVKGLIAQANESKQLKQQWQQYQSDQFAQKAYSHFDNLVSSAKIENPVEKDLYKSAVEAEVFRRESRGEKLGLQDLDKIFNGFHDKYSKYKTDLDRQTTAKYATSKKADQSPTGVTGGAATSPVTKKFSSIDSPEAIKWLADELRRTKQQE